MMSVEVPMEMWSVCKCISSVETGWGAGYWGSKEGWARFERKRMGQFCRNKTPSSQTGTMLAYRVTEKRASKSKICSKRYVVHLVEDQVGHLGDPQNGLMGQRCTAGASLTATPQAAVVGLVHQ